MAAPPFFTELLLVLIVATLVAVVFERLRLPAILGFLLAGVALGPHGFGLLPDTEAIHQLAELGVILLMLTIGLEFSFDRLKGLFKVAVVGGGLQLLLSVTVGMVFAAWKAWTPYQGFMLGSVIALSSTAIVFNYLIHRGELDTHHGRIAVAILIFQDLAVVPLLIFMTGMGAAGSIVVAIGIASLKAVLLLGGVVIAARWIVPLVFQQIAHTQNREIFLLAAVVVCLGIAWISGRLGLSLAIGAFFAGLMFANNDYGQRLMTEIVPLRHVFVSLFFVSIGLLFDLTFALTHMGVVLRVVGLVIMVNFVLMTILVMTMGFPPRIALAVGILLSQIGEFSFLLLEAGRATGSIDPHFYHVLFSATFVTMMLTPLLFGCIPHLVQLAAHARPFGMQPGKARRAAADHRTMQHHIILCGFGRCGQDLASTLLEERVPFVLVEMNPQHVRKAREQHIPAVYGDAANVTLMEHAGIQHARAVVVSFGDQIGMAQIIRVVEYLNPDVHLVVRARYERDVARLYELGADVVVLEEWEVDYELHRVLLRHLGVPHERIVRHIKRIVTRMELVVEQAILQDEKPN